MFKHKHNMGFKTLTIKDKVYGKLMKVKHKEESFSEFLDKLVETSSKKVDIMKFAGAWNKMSDEEFKKMKKAIVGFRESANKNFEERMKRL